MKNEIKIALLKLITCILVVFLSILLSYGNMVLTWGLEVKSWGWFCFFALSVIFLQFLLQTILSIKD